MWYFTWVLGIGFAVLLAILNALWGEHEDARAQPVADDAAPDLAPDAARP
ncbi:cytochrome bd-I oxidase subunit CydX [Azoarcus olearius]